MHKFPDYVISCDYDLNKVKIIEASFVILFRILRSSRPEVSVKKVFLEIFQACNFIKKESLAQVFSCEIFEISKNTFYYRTPPVAASESS